MSKKAKRLIRVVAVGCGTVGKAFLACVLRGREELARRMDAEVRVLAVVTSRACVAATPHPISDEELGALARGEETVANLPGALQHSGWNDPDLYAALLPYGGDVTFVDMTAGDHAALHAAWLRRGHSVVTANKKPLAASLDEYRPLAAAAGQGRYRYETTVGAGLPVLATLGGLLASGEQFLSLEAMLSGTIGYVLSACGDGVPFVDAVAEAKRLGYTEPNPCDDLCGDDVAVKALILARLVGLDMEPYEVVPCGLIPDGLRHLPMEECAPLFSDVGRDLDRRMMNAPLLGKRMRYLVRIEDGRVSVGPELVPSHSVFGRLSGPRNAFRIRTSPSYDASPLIIEGPGAGPDATAAGVMEDVLRLHIAR